MLEKQTIGEVVAKIIISAFMIGVMMACLGVLTNVLLVQKIGILMLVSSACSLLMLFVASIWVD